MDATMDFGSDTEMTVSPVLSQKRLHSSVFPRNLATNKRLHRQLEEAERQEAQLENCPVYFIPCQRYTYTGSANEGFDDANGRYITKAKDHFSYRYEIKSKLGMGAFGDCYKVLDHKTNEVVALKVIRNERRFKAQGLIEINILNSLLEESEQNSTVRMIDNFTFRQHLCITFDLHGEDLYTTLSSRGFKGFANVEAAIGMYNVLKCMSLLKRKNIVHADLKPENILVSGSDGEVVVIDFGSSAFESEKVNTYIQSRYYRAPEIVLGMVNQGCAIDMWSLGCILYELIIGRPLFHAKSEQDLLLYHQQLLGNFPTEMVQNCRRSKTFLNNYNGNVYQPVSCVDRRGRTCTPNTRNLTDLLRGYDWHLIEFIQKCLHLDPTKRITPDQALQHPFITKNTHKHLESLTSLARSKDLRGASLISNSSNNTTGSTESLDSGLEDELEC